MKRLVGIISTGIHDIKLYKDFNYLRSLEIHLEFSDGYKEKISVYDLKRYLKELEIRSIKLFDAGIISILLFDDYSSISLAL
jgi:hypothetical protein